MALVHYVALLICCGALAHALSTDEAQTLSDYGYVTVIDNGDTYTLQSNGMPDHEYGPFPSHFNPNTASVQRFNFRIPSPSTEASTPGCLPMGPIGISLNGVALFNPYTHLGYNAVHGANAETFDDCSGHPDTHGVYHYHQIPNCLVEGRESELIGVAMDGFPIYGPQDASGNTLTSADLDLCHGIEVDGSYRYHMTYDFPYILGCFHGDAPFVNSNGQQCVIAHPDNVDDNGAGGNDGGGNGGNGGGNGDRHPPPGRPAGRPPPPPGPAGHPPPPPGPAGRPPPPPGPPRRRGPPRRGPPRRG